MKSARAEWRTRGLEAGWLRPEEADYTPLWSDLSAQAAWLSGHFQYIEDGTPDRWNQKYLRVSDKDGLSDEETLAFLAAPADDKALVLLPGERTALLSALGGLSPRSTAELAAALRRGPSQGLLDALAEAVEADVLNAAAAKKMETRPLSSEEYVERQYRVDVYAHGLKLLYPTKGKGHLTDRAFEIVAAELGVEVTPFRSSLQRRGEEERRGRSPLRRLIDRVDAALERAN